MYKIIGKVIEGKKRGKTLGYPTINIHLDKEIPSGIYASKVAINGRSYNAATFIGNATTFGEKEYKLESYILDFNEDIYGKTVQVDLLKKIRGNEKFTSKELLIKQIEKDVEETKKFFEPYK